MQFLDYLKAAAEPAAIKAAVALFGLNDMQRSRLLSIGGGSSSPLGRNFALPPTTQRG